MDLKKIFNIRSDDNYNIKKSTATMTTTEKLSQCRALLTHTKRRKYKQHIIIADTIHINPFALRLCWAFQKYCFQNFYVV